MKEKIILTQEQKELVENNLAFVTYVAKRYFSSNNYERNQDIIQEGILAMCNAIGKYDPERAKLTTYMFPTIDGHLKRFVGYRDRLIPIPHQKHLKQETQDKAKNAKIVFSLDKTHTANSVNEDFSLMDIIPDDLNLETSTVNRLCVNDAILQLEWREKIVIIYRYYFDLGQAYIGKLMHMSQVHIHRIEKKALKSMKNFITA